MHVYVQCDAAQNWQECSMQPTSGRSQNPSAWALLSAAGAQRWGMCKWDQLLPHTQHKLITVLQFDKCTELQDFLLFCAVILRDKELLCPWLQIFDSGAKWAWWGAAVGAGLQCVEGTGIISFPESLALQYSNSQVSALAYRVGNIFVLPKVQLLTLARQLLFPVSRNPICSIQ